MANEVKELARETARATDEIGRKIAAIQLDTSDAMRAIEQISLMTSQISDAQTTIASAVEEQTATTNEMVRNVDDASRRSSEIADNISIVAQAAESTSSGAAETQIASGELARLAVNLEAIASRFQFDDDRNDQSFSVRSETPAGALPRIDQDCTDNLIFSPVSRDPSKDRLARTATRAEKRPLQKGELV